MNPIMLVLLTLAMSLAPILSWAAEPTVDQAPAAELLPKASDNDAALAKAAKDERVKVLTQIVEVMMSQYKVGTIDFLQLSSAQDELCEAQLDSTDEPEKRVALLTKQLERANNVVKLLQAKLDAGPSNVSGVDVLRAKSLYLKVKIRLLCERSRKGPPMPASPGKQP